MKIMIPIILLGILASCSTSRQVSRNLATSQNSNKYHIEDQFVVGNYSKYRTADGPVVIPNGPIYFTSVDKIFYLDLDHKVHEVFSLENGALGGMELDRDNNLYAIDYKNHRIFFFKKIGNAIDFSSPEIIIKNDKLFQPNDMAIMKNGDFLFADAKWRGDKKGILWFAARDGSDPVKLYEIDQPFVGIAYDENEGHIYLTTAGKDFIVRCKFNIDEKNCSEIKKIRIGNSSWSLDGISINLDTHEVFVSRINKRRIDVYSSDLEYKNSICLSQNRDCTESGEVKGLSSKPSDITFDEKRKRLIITHFGDRKLKEKKKYLKNREDILDVHKSHLQVIQLE